jgi:hypothetical protein
MNLSVTFRCVDQSVLIKTNNQHFYLSIANTSSEIKTNIMYSLLKTPSGPIPLYSEPFVTCLNTANKNRDISHDP